MSTYRLVNPKVRANAIEAVRTAPDGYRVSVVEPKRSDAQSDLMWELLGQLAKKTTYHGLKLDKDDWKLVMMSGLRRQVRLVQNYDDDGLVALGQASSKLTVSEMTMMIDLIEAWAGTNGVTLVRTIPGYEA